MTEEVWWISPKAPLAVPPWVCSLSPVHCPDHAGASIAAAPIIAVSLLASEYQQSFAALLVGFALSEAWRAPAAIMIRDVSPQQLGSTASAIHLCFRNLIGGLGPLGTPPPL